MDIQDVGAIGELTAAIATILTLLYLARQIQLGSKTIQASNLSTMVDAMSAMHDTNKSILGFFDPSHSDNRDLTDLSDGETFAIHIHCVQMFIGFETAFLFHLNGTVDDQYFDARMRTVKRLHTFPYWRHWWEEWAHDLYDERFVEYVNTLWAEVEVTEA